MRPRRASHQALKARLDLEARVAQAYGEVLVAQEAFQLNSRHSAVVSELARQTDLRFKSGEAPRSDQAQAQQRAASGIHLRGRGPRPAGQGGRDDLDRPGRPCPDVPGSLTAPRL